METRANHVLVGLFVVVFAVGAAAFAIWIAALQADRQTDRYLLLFQGSVTGLSVGSAVNYEGVRVGEVVAIELDDADPGRVRVIADIAAGTPVRSDTVATLEMAGLTGGRYVQLSGGTADAPRPVAAAGESYPSIPTRASPIERVLEGAPDVVTALNRLLERAEAIVSDENAQRVERILEEGAITMGNLSDTSAVFADMARDIREDSGTLLLQANRTMASIEALSASLESAGQEVGPTVAEVRRAASAVQGLADGLNQLVQENQRPLSDFTSSGLGELSQLLAQLRRLTGTLNDITQDVQQNPAGFLFGAPPAGYRPGDE